MRKAEVYWKNVIAGILTETDGRTFEFSYDAVYLADNSKPPVSLTLPKNQQVHSSNYLFPCFYNMLSEGANREIQTRQLKIDKEDFFGLLLATARYDTIGAITIQPIN